MAWAHLGRFTPRAWILFALVLVSASIQGQEKAAVPDAAAQKDAEKMVREVYKEEYAKNSAKDREDLADKLLEQARQSRDNPASQFVLFREAQEMYAGAGNYEKCMGTVDEWAKLYRIDPLDLKSSALAKAGKNAKSGREVSALASAYLRLAEDAVNADQYDSAKESTTTAAAVARRINNTALASRAALRSREIVELKGKYEKLKKTRETLASNPEDPAANLAVGKFLCLEKGDWPNGLPFLAKGSDATLQSLAGKDILRPTDASQRVMVGDGWWDLSEKEGGAIKEALRKRAVFWYEQALPKWTSLGQSKAEKRLTEYRLERVNRGRWVDVTDPRMYGLPGKPGESLRVAEGSNVVLERFPKGDFDGLSVRVQAITTDAIWSVQYIPRSRDVEINVETGRLMACHLENRLWMPDHEVDCPQKKEYLMTLLMVEGEVIAYVDGVETLRFKESADKVEGLRIAELRGSAIFDQIRLRKKE